MPEDTPREPEKDTEARVRRALERELAEIDSPARAEEVAEYIEDRDEAATEEQVGERVEEDPRSAAAAIEAARRGRRGGKRVAKVLSETAAQEVAETPDAEPVVEAAQSVLTPSAPVQRDGRPVPPATRRGRDLLRDAVLRRMRPLDALDARVFLLVNGLPHPLWADRLADSVSVLTRGGWIWSASVLFGALLGIHGSWRALVTLVPCVAVSTLIVEHPIKELFRRRRPFVDVIRAVVIGKRPGSWSFPSGHTASSFAAAWILSLRWPRHAPVFGALAAIVGFSRIYVGAHYPGDVATGGFLGAALAEMVRRSLGGGRNRGLWRFIFRRW